MRNLVIITAAVIMSMTFTSCNNSNKKHNKEKEYPEIFEDVVYPRSTDVFFIENVDDVEVSENAEIYQYIRDNAMISNNGACFELEGNIDILYKDGEEMKKKRFHYVSSFEFDETIHIDVVMSKDDKTMFSLVKEITTYVDGKALPETKTDTISCCLFD